MYLQSQVILAVGGFVRPLLPGVSSSLVIGYARSHLLKRPCLIKFVIVKAPADLCIEFFPSVSSEPYDTLSCFQ